MKSFEDLRPRTNRAQTRFQERQLRKKLEELLKAGDEESFRAGLEEDFGVKPDHPKFQEMLRIWRNAR